MLLRLPVVNYYHKALHLGCWSSPRSVSVYIMQLPEASSVYRNEITDNLRDDFEPPRYHAEKGGLKRLFEFLTYLPFLNKNRINTWCLRRLTQLQFIEFPDFRLHKPYPHCHFKSTSGCMFDKKRYLLVILETDNKITFNYQVFFIRTVKFTILIHFYKNFNLLFFLPGSKIAYFIYTKKS